LVVCKSTLGKGGQSRIRCYPSFETSWLVTTHRKQKNPTNITTLPQYLPATSQLYPSTSPTEDLKAISNDLSFATSCEARANALLQNGKLLNKVIYLVFHRKIKKRNEIKYIIFLTSYSHSTSSH